MQFVKKMKSHLLLLCLYCVPVVYCRDTLSLEDLDYNRLTGFVNFDATLNEWEAAINQNIMIEVSQDYSRRVDVKREVSNFVKTGTGKTPEELEMIQSVIYGAYHCTVQKYATLVLFMQLQDLRPLKNDLAESKNRVLKKYGKLEEKANIYNNVYLKEEFENLGVKYPLDFVLKTPYADLTVRTDGEFKRTGEKKVKTIWDALVNKEPKFEIQYDVYVDVLKSKDQDYTPGSIEGEISEISCVYNEIIRLIDVGVVEKCTQHGGSFVKGYSSLKHEINEAFEQYLLELDALHEDDIGPKFYTDHSGRGTSGCFLKKMKFSINNLEKNYATTENASVIYGENAQRISKNLVVSSENAKNTGSSKSQQGIITPKHSMVYVVTLDETANAENNQLIVVDQKPEEQKTEEQKPEEQKPEEQKPEEKKEKATMEMVVVEAPPPPPKPSVNDYYTDMLSSALEMPPINVIPANKDVADNTDLLSAIVPVTSPLDPSSSTPQKTSSSSTPPDPNTDNLISFI